MAAGMDQQQSLNSLMPAATAMAKCVAVKVEGGGQTGTIVAQLETSKAPKSTANFLKYVDAKFYSDTIFHRVIPGFMIQGGGFTADMQEKPTNAPVVNEADNGLLNKVGTLAMARTSDPNSATAQWFINLVDNVNLDHTSMDAQGMGYAVFGHVVSGMDIVNQIATAQTSTQGSFENVPTSPITIKDASVTPCPSASAL